VAQHSQVSPQLPRLRATDGIRAGRVSSDEEAAEVVRSDSLKSQLQDSSSAPFDMALSKTASLVKFETGEARKTSITLFLVYFSTGL
jgi:hypothetical protein